jgi:hypothetical protein
MLGRRVVIGWLGAVVALGAAWATEERIHRSDLPPAVERTVAAQDAETVRGFSREFENGQTLYEAELTVKGRSRDILIDSTGTIIEIEQEVTLDSLPADVQRGLHEGAGSGQLLRIESVVKRNRLVAYEAQVERNGKKSEIQVGPDGKRLGHAE